MLDRVSQRAEKEASWRLHLEAQSRSGGSVRAYCRRHGLLQSSFRFWRQSIARRDLEGQLSTRAEGAGLVAVQVVDELALPSANKGRLEIELVGGLVVRLREDVGVECLQQVLRACQKVSRSNVGSTREAVRSC